jgi:hypothetical protein
MRPERQDVALRVAVAVVAVVVAVEAALLLWNPFGEAGTPDDVTDVRVRVPQPPEQAFSKGSYVESRVTAGGSVTVQQWVQSQDRLTTLDLRLPALAGRNRTVRARNVLVAADRVVLERTGTVGTAGRRLDLGGPTSVVYLRYTLSGLMDRGASGRRRALALALDVRPFTGPSRVLVVGDNVQSVTCTRRQGAEPRPCGAPTTNGWRVLLRGERRSTLVQARVAPG